MSARKLLIATAAALAFACAAPGAFAAYASITVFGDSLSDGGNDFIFSGGTFPPPPFAQRFTNGPTAVENLAGRLGLPLAPSLAGGSNFAFGGAETGIGNFLAVSPSVPPAINFLFSGPPAFPATGILAQVQSFVAVPPAGFGGAEDLVVLWGGPNDLFTALAAGQNPVGIIAPAIGNLATSVGLLYGAGARSILMPGMPNLGATPFGLGTDPAGLTAFSVAFNFFLAQAIGQLESSLPGLNITEFDTFGALNAITANPGTFGFTNVTTPCFDGVSVCANPDEYLFWDDVHPTARGHALLGAQFATAVPEPAAILLMLTGLLAVAFGQRQRAG